MGHTNDFIILSQRNEDHLSTSVTASAGAASKAAPLACRRLPVFDTESWDSVLTAFADAEVCHYRQHWLQQQQDRFLPGSAKTGFDDDAIWILAEFADIDIHNPAIELNEDAYKIGDVFEIFLRALPLEEYIEFHVTPENQRLQLWWPRTKQSGRDDGWKSHYLVEPHFQSWTQIVREDDCWRVLVSIPYDNLNSSAPQSGHEWLFSFSRYDYTRGKKQPILSSTSPHQQADFHRHHEWGRLMFRDEK